MNRSALAANLLAGAGFVALLTVARAGRAEQPPPVDVVIHDTPPPSLPSGEDFCVFVGQARQNQGSRGRISPCLPCFEWVAGRI